MKINLVLARSNWTSFHNHTWKPILSESFNIVFIEDNPSINKDDSVLYSNPDDIWYRNLHDQGYKLVLDRLWGDDYLEYTNTFLLKNVNFFWYDSALTYKYNRYDQYQPNHHCSKLALMPMGNVHSYRDQLFDLMKDRLDDFVWSYVERFGKRLPNDDGQSFKYAYHFNPDWYDSTYFSLISETSIYPTGILVSEKIFKPLSFYHPFIVWGRPEVLKHLHSNGFETFENIFDESYDSIIDNDQRLDAVVKNVTEFKRVPYDQITNGKLSHNHALLFDMGLVNRKISEEIINPILEFFEKR